MRRHCPQDAGFEIEATSRYEFLRVDGEETFLFLLNRRDKETNPEL